MKHRFPFQSLDFVYLECIITSSSKENTMELGFEDNYIKGIIKQFPSEIYIDDAISEYTLLIIVVKYKSMSHVEIFSEKLLRACITIYFW